MNKIEIIYHTQQHLKDLIEINSDELCLCFLDVFHTGGLQSMFEEGTPEYEKQLKLLYNIADSVRELVKINTNAQIKEVENESKNN